MYKEIITKLAEAYQDDEDALEVITDAVDSFCDYIYAICRMETRLPVLSATLKGEEYRASFTELDTNRSRCHDAAIANVGVLNRVTEGAGLGKIYTGDPTDRLAVAAFCKEIVDELFAGRVGAPEKN